MNFQRDLFSDTLRKGGAELGIKLDSQQIEQMAQFASELVIANEMLNLTRIVEAEEMAIKNFLDSLSLLLLQLPENSTCLDVGTGAGFPGIPLALMKPTWSIVLLDSLRKRLDFLDQAYRNLSLKNITIMHARAEDAGRDMNHREKYDLVVSRAVASLPILLELCTPLVKEEGKFIAYKGDDALNELAESEGALEELNVSLEQVFSLSLPLGMGERNLLVFKKQGATPERYPRRPGIPAKRPL